MKTSLIGFAATLLMLTIFQQAALAQDDVKQQLEKLTQRMDKLEATDQQPLTIVHRETGGAAIWLFGSFCALWAQNTNRSAWLWFFMGILFSVITVIVLLSKNAQDRRRKAQPTG